jgi:hypothetical protein
MKRLIAILLATLAAACFACGTLPPVVGKTVDCSGESVRSRWVSILPAVNQCIGDVTVGDYTSCLLALVNPAAGISLDVVACLVRERGASAVHASQANPDDARSTRAAERAHAFLASQKIAFVP